MVDFDGNIFYYLNDHLGSTRVMVKSDGTIQDRYNRYLVFGGDDGSSTTLNNAYKYTGKPFDDEHGFDLFYYGTRYYDGEGRFTQIDPLRNKYPSLSPYVYTANNPLKYVDPDGRIIMIPQNAVKREYVTTWVDMARNGDFGNDTKQKVNTLDKSSTLTTITTGELKVPKDLGQTSAIFTDGKLSSDVTVTIDVIKSENAPAGTTPIVETIAHEVLGHAYEAVKNSDSPKAKSKTDNESIADRRQANFRNKNKKSIKRYNKSVNHLKKSEDKDKDAK